jgi:hypothetical protein
MLATAFLYWVDCRKKELKNAAEMEAGFHRRHIHSTDGASILYGTSRNNDMVRDPLEKCVKKE